MARSASRGFFALTVLRSAPPPRQGRCAAAGSWRPRAIALGGDEATRHQRVGVISDRQRAHLRAVFLKPADDDVDDARDRAGDPTRTGLEPR